MRSRLAKERVRACKMLLAMVLALIGATALASTAPPHDYYLLSPEPLSGALSVMSLEPNNTITFGDQQITLQQYQRATIPATAFTSGTRFGGTGFFTLGSNENAADLLAPDDFAGTAFVVPHIAGSHRYFVLSPSGAAQVSIQIGANTYNLTAAAGIVNEFDAGSANGLAGRVTSDVPILLAHVAYSSGAPTDAYPVPPANLEVLGIRSQNTVIAALSDGTSVTVYASSGASASYVLNAGEQVAVAIGSGATQGQGNALRVVANAPVAAVQYDDGDGADATAFWPASSYGRRHAIPVNAQYLAVACDQPNTTLTLYRGANAPEVQNCSGSSTTPGKAYFGSNTSGANLAAGWYLISSSPVYAMYEAASPEDEHNLLGVTPPTGPTPPVLDSIASPTANNPQTVSGAAGANQVIRLYANGLLQSTTTANSSGAYTFAAALIDGGNTLYTTAVSGGNESDPSNAVTVNYVNSIPRNQSGTISGTVVWTPGSPAAAYTVTAADLTIATGAQLILQPGTQVRFGNGRRLTVNGTLVVNGTSGASVVFTSDLATPTRGSWAGLRINAGASVTIANALIEWAATGIDAAASANFTLTGSTIRNFSSNGIVFNGASTASITGSTIDNLNDSGTCIYMAANASPTVQTTIIANCTYGVYLAANGTAGPQPIVSPGNQLLSHGSYSVFSAGGSYPTNSHLLLNFTNNWWGTTDAATIANTIYDVTDSPTSTTLPSINFGSLLNGAGGTPIAGNYIQGVLTAPSTTLTAATYDVLGVLVVPTGKTLIIEPGATLRFHANNGYLRADGTLQIGGTAQTTLTAGKAPPTRGIWPGIRVTAGATVTITNTLIEWATTAIEAAANANFTLTGGTIRNFSNNGIVFNGASTASISGSTIDNLNDTGSCIYMAASASPTIQTTTIANCTYGVYLAANGTVGPLPIVSPGNQLLSHGSYSVFTAGGSYPANSNVLLNFTNNWWGTTDAATIANTIYDVTDSPTSTTLPSVDFGSLLNGPGGTPTPGTYIQGVLTAPSTTLTSGTTYEVLGILVVPTGKTLIVEPGATLRFHANNGFLRADGTVQIGGGTALTTLTAGKAPPTRGSWPGIRVSAGANVTITNTLIEWATTAIEAAANANFTLTGSTIRNFSNNGIVFNGASTASISGSTIDNLNDTGSCIYMAASASPTVQTTTVANCTYGVYLAANGTVGPQPIFSPGNQLLSHGSYSVFSAGGSYPTNSHLLLNFTNNWWGTTDAATIANTIYDVTDSPTSTTLPSINFGSLANSPGGTPIAGNYIQGVLAAPSTTLTAGTYDVLGILVVPTGKTLIIEPGATLRFHANNGFLRADGTLQIGNSSALTTLTAGKAPPTRGVWPGIRVTAGATVTITNTLIEWATTAIEAAANANFTLTGGTIRNFSSNGIVFNGASTASISGSTIDNLNDTGSCIYMAASASPTIQTTTIANCTYGVYLAANGTVGPQPIVSPGNQLLSHGSYSVFTAGGSYPANSHVQLNFTNNWWGTTDTAAIANTIYDVTDSPTSTTLPSVNFGSLLDGAGGAPTPGTYIQGVLTATSTTLTAGTTYEVLGILVVPTGKTLIIEPGATVRFHATNGFLRADGTLQIGSSSALTTLTAGKAPPTRGAWPGIRISAGANVTITNTLIEWAATAIEAAANANFTLTSSTIRNFNNNGIVFNGASTASITGSTIDNLNDTGSCIYMAGSASPTVQTTIIANCTYGLYLAASGTAGPQPIVSPGNQLLSHSSYSVFTAGGSYPTNSHVLLNFTNNWWGTTDAAIISNTIYDFTDSPTSTTLPSVNFGSMLDGPGGAPVAGNFVIGALSPASTTFAAGSTYEVLGILLVPSGKSLTVEAGATLRFHTTQTRILVDGTLAIQGTAASPVRLTSGLVDPVKGSWSGIEVRATATNVVIDYAIIEWAARAVSVTNTNATISNSIIRNFSDTGIAMTGASSASQIVNNYIDNLDGAGYGIYLTASSPAITNNQIHRTSVGIYAIGASNPAITGNAITNNGRGIVLDGNGSNSAAAVPNPVITGNDIFDNTSGQIEIYRYGASNPVVINAMDNWWGTATPVVGQHIRFTSGSPASTLNHSNPSSTPRTRPVSGNITVSLLYFSPNGDGVRDTTVIAGSLNQSASWTVTVRNAAHNAVRTYSGSGAAISAAWDGRNGGGSVQPDGVYTFEVSASGPSGSGIVGSRAATLDNTPPATVITAPTASTTLTNIVTVPVTGSAADTYLVNFILQYGVGAAPTTWTTLNSQNTTGITNGLLGNWVVSSTTGTGTLANGPYVLRLSTSDKAGNVGLVQIPVALDLLSITAVTQSRQLMKPLAGEQLQVNFTLGAPASVTMQVYPEAGGPLLWQTSQNYSSGGAKSMTWNGRTTAGAYVGDDAYSYVLQATDGARSAAYDPPAPNNVGSGTGNVDAAFNANKNDFWKMDYTMNHFGRVRMQVSGCTTPTHFPYNWTPFPPGIHPLIWDGRGADGQLVSGACNIYFDAPMLMKPNTVVVRGTSPVISGAGASPNIEVKSNPYRITHSYEQFSKVTYRVDQDSYVTIKLLPPGVSDPASPAAIVLTSNELRQAQSGGQPLNHEFEWKGYEALDTNDILVSAEGSYTFAIQATSVGSGATALYRGVLQLMQ